MNQADVVDAVGIAKVVLVDAEVTVQDAVLRALVIVADVVDAVGLAVVVQADAVGLAKVVLDAQDAEDHAQAHARRVEKARLVLHAIVALAVLVHAHHVHHVVDAVGAVDAVGYA